MKEFSLSELIFQSVKELPTDERLMKLLLNADESLGGSYAILRTRIESDDRMERSDGRNCGIDTDRVSGDGDKKHLG